MNPNAQQIGSMKNKFEYSLTSIVNHYGEVDYGHYTANVLNFLNKKWYLMNDSKGS
jgi:ubiquitin C-terminal hydrolase